MLCGETDDVGAPHNDDIYDALLCKDLPTTSSQLEVLFHNLKSFLRTPRPSFAQNSGHSTHHLETYVN